MDFIPVVNTTGNFVFSIAITTLGAALLLFSLVVFLRTGRGRGFDPFPVIMLVAGVAFTLIGLDTIFADPARNTALVERQQNAAREELNESYGFELGEDQFAQLKYPVDAPTDSFRSYGSTSVVLSPEPGDYTKTEISLVAEGGELILVGEDGKEVEALPEDR